MEWEKPQSKQCASQIKKEVEHRIGICIVCSMMQWMCFCMSYRLHCRQNGGCMIYDFALWLLIAETSKLPDSTFSLRIILYFVSLCRCSRKYARFVGTSVSRRFSLRRRDKAWRVLFLLTLWPHCTTQAQEHWKLIQIEYHFHNNT